MPTNEPTRWDLRALTEVHRQTTYGSNQGDARWLPGSGEQVKKIMAGLSVVASVVLGAGCSGVGVDEAEASSTPTVTVTTTAAPTCRAPAPVSVRLMASMWELVVASKGARDHAHYSREFSDEVKELVEDLEDGQCQATAQMTAAAHLNYQGTVLAAISPTPQGPSVADYDETVRVGNELFQAFGIEDAQFIPVTCAGKVHNSPACSGLR